MGEITRRDLILGGGLMLAGSGSALSELCTHNPAATELSTRTQIEHRWIRTARILIAEGYAPPFYPLLEYDPEKAVRLAKALNANAFRFPAASYFAYFPTQTNYPVHPQLAGDPMRETFRLCRAANLKTIAYLPINHPFMDVRDNNPHFPLWQRVDLEGRPLVTTHFGFSRYYEGCLISPLRGEIIGLLNEILDHDVDLVYFDGPYQGMDHRTELCYCKWCRSAFSKATGSEIPVQGGGADAAIEYTRWIADDVAKGFLAELTETVRHARDIPVLFNNTSMLSRGWCRSRSIASADGFMFESAETPEQKLFNLQLGMSTGKQIWTYVGYHSQYNREHLKDKSIRGWYSYPLDEDNLLMDGSVAFSAGVGMAFWGLNRLYSIPHSPSEYSEVRAVRTIFDLMGHHGDLLGSVHSSPQAGLLVNSQSIEWCNAPSMIPQAYSNGFRGIWQLMQESSITAEPFLDFTLERRQLNRYRLVYVSNAACLSIAQCTMLEDFVAAGGTLVATHLSGLYDEVGRTQHRRPLHDLLGISFIADEPEERPELYLKTDGDNELIPQDPQIVRFRSHDGVKVLATTFDLAHRENVGAAITQRPHGKGQAIYIGSNLEAIYDETRLHSVRAMLLSLLEPALGSSRRYCIETSEGVMAQYAEGSEAILLHLIANTGNKIKKARARESYLPATNTKVLIRIPPGKSADSVRLLRAERAAVFKRCDGWIELQVDRIYIHETIVVKLAL